MWPAGHSGPLVMLPCDAHHTLLQRTLTRPTYRVKRKPLHLCPARPNLLDLETQLLLREVFQQCVDDVPDLGYIVLVFRFVVVASTRSLSASTKRIFTCGA